MVSVVKRGEEIYIPDGNFVLKCGDHICLTANFAEIQKLTAKIEKGPTTQTEDTIIAQSSSEKSDSKEKELEAVARPN